MRAARRPWNVARWLGAGMVLAVVMLASLATPTGRAAWARSMAAAGTSAARLVLSMVPAASAQETLEFKEVPPESVPQPRERPRRRAPRVVVPPIPPDVDIAPKVVGQSGDVMKIGSDIEVEEDQVISGDVLVVGADAIVAGHVEGNVVSMGGNVELTETARVDGDVVCMGGRLKEEPGAFIGGQRVTTGGFSGFPGVKVRGPRMRIGDGIGDAVGWMLWLLILMGLAWAFTRLAPGSTGAALETLKTRTALSLGIGAMVWALLIPSLIALVLVVAFLCITIIGIPLALASLFGYFLFVALLCVWGYVVGMAAIGDMLLRRVSAPPPLHVPTTPTSAAMASAPAPVAVVEHSLTRKAIVGVLLIGGLELVGRFFRVFDFVAPLHAIGGLFMAVAKIACVAATTFGIGAWLRAEFASGTLGRWWSGRRQIRNPMKSGGAVAPDPNPVVPPPAPPPTQG